MFLSRLAEQPILVVVGLGAMVLALVLHEFGHALMAHAQGDSTPQRLGRLTLNPLAHLDLWGTLLMLLVGFGWAKPVSYNPNNLRWKRFGPVFVALAGPSTNLLCAVLSAVALGVLGYFALGDSNALIVFLQLFLLISVYLAVFNLLPFPPLDGSELVRLALDRPRYTAIRLWWERYASIAFLILIGADILLGFGVLSGVVSWISGGILLVLESFMGFF